MQPTDKRIATVEQWQALKGVIDGNIGKARELTTDDYNWPDSNPDGVALWLMPAGMYYSHDKKVYITNTSYTQSDFYIVGKPSSYASRPILYLPIGSTARGTIFVVDSTGIQIDSAEITTQIIDNLTSTSTNSALSANQGRVLKGLIDAIAVPTKTSDLTNDGSDGTSTYVEADELASVATSGSYNDLLNKPTIPTVPTVVSAFTNDAGYQTASQVNTAVGLETTARQSADNNLQQQIDAISASSDVKDVVGTKAELNNYDTTTLGDNDIIKVLQDESENGETTYYRWSTTTSTFTLIGEEGPYYTKSEADALLNAKANISSLATVATSGSYNDLNNKPTIPDAQIQSDWNQITTTAKDYIKNKPANLVSDVSYVHTDNNFTTALKTKLDGIASGAEVNVQANWDETSTTSDAYIQNKPDLATVATTGAYSDLTGVPSLATVATSGSYNDLTNKPTIPTVNDATLTIQANGTTVNTFTANASSNVTANIPSATTDRYGVTQLSDSTSSTSTALAATSSAVKSAYDLAGTKAKITMSSTDPGEGVALAENEYIAVYGGDAMNLDYSTTEKATGGTWIDGSAIYKKTVNFGALPNNADKTVAHDISNLGRVVKLEGMAYEPSNSTYAPLPYASDSTSAIDVSIVDSNIRIHTFTDRTAFSDAYITIYYTKSS